MEVDVEEAKHDVRETRDRQLMKRFLNGNLNIGSSMNIRRNSHKIIFNLKGKEQKKALAWWEKKQIHPNRRTVNVKLIVHEQEVTNDYQLTRDFKIRKPPLTHVQVIVTPACYTNVKGKEIRTTALIDHDPIPQAPTFYLQDIDCRKGYANLIQFIRDTVTFQQQVAHRAAVKAAQWRPFIAPSRLVQEPARQTIPLDSYTSRLQAQEIDDDDDIIEEVDEQDEASILAEANEIAYRAASRHIHRNTTVKDVFNDDVVMIQQKKQSEEMVQVPPYHPTLLLSCFSFSPSQSQASQASSTISQTSQLQNNFKDYSTMDAILQINNLAAAQNNDTYFSNTWS